MSGLLTCLAASVAWLLGIAWQTSEQALWPLWAYLAGSATGGAALCLALAAARLLSVRASRPSPWPALWRGAAVCLGLVLLAWGTTGWRATLRMREAVPMSWLGRPVSVRVQIEGLPQPVPGGVLVDARALSWQQEDADAGAQKDGHLPAHISLRMGLQGETLPWSGQQWQLLVQLHAPDGLSNPGGYDGTLAYFERGVRAVGKVVGRNGAAIKLSDAPERAWQGCIDRTRQRIRQMIVTHVPDQRAAGILAGLTVGDQSAIEHDDWTLFRTTGVAHLVSISGAHIAMFGWMAALFVRRAWSRWPRGMHVLPAPDVALWAAVIASALYAVISGWGVPAQRTVWMMLMMAWLRTGGRRWPWPLVWLGSAVVLTALDPWAMRQVGFWLSYVAVGVLLASGDWTRSFAASAQVDAPMPQRVMNAVKRHVNELLRIQVLITLALLPLSLVCFQQASVVSLLANLVAIPVFTIGITPLAMLGVIWPWFWGAGAWLIDATLQLLAAISMWWPSMAAAPVVPWWVGVGGVAAGCALALPMHSVWRIGLAPFFLALFWLPQAWHLQPPPKPGVFSVTAVDIGQGTAVLVRTAHHTLLFDTGPRIGEQLNAGDRTLLPLFRSMGITALDTLMISHQDTDHVGGAQTIVREVAVGRMVSSLDEGHALRHQPGKDGRPLPHQPCVAGMRWAWDGVAFEVLHPWPQDYEDRSEKSPNAMSCVLKVSAGAGAGERSVLLTGDIEARQEAALVQQSAKALRSTVLIAPHHGSQTSSTDAFVDAVRPKQVVVQVGRRNVYGHPSPPVLARYDDKRISWVASPACGAYVWFSDEAPGLTASAAVHPATVPAGELKGAQPELGTCWRPGHHHYWDDPSPMGMSSRPRKRPRT